MGSNDEMAPYPGITIGRRADRASNELVGICRGLLADGHVNQQEAEFLKDWIERNSAFVGEYPFAPIYSLLSNILRDGVIDSDESADLHDTLVRFVGGEAYDAPAQTASRSTALPIDDPAPEIVFPSSLFVVTGTFSYGTRAHVTAAIEQRGGILSGTPSKKVHYLVIGDLGSRDWVNSNAGTKIQKAVELRNGGHSIAIVSEGHWGTCLVR